MATRKISARKVLGDVRLGLNDLELMNKYNLTSKQLEDILRQLVEVGVITHMELYERTRLSDTQITKAFVDGQDFL
jgi:hypothetical protein